MSTLSAWIKSRSERIDKEETSCASLRVLWSGFVDAFVHCTHSRGLHASPTSAHDFNKCPWKNEGILPAHKRVVALGDLHGDLDKTREALRLAEVIDGSDRWIGGDVVVVQVGDVLDRGKDEVAMLYFLERLKRDADRSGGAFLVLNGNHETMNVGGRFRYATEEGALDFDRWREVQRIGKALKHVCGDQEGNCRIGSLENRPEGIEDRWSSRYAALRPGGPLATRFLAHQPTTVQVGSTLFVHGGLLPEHCDYGLHRINQEVREWIMGNKGSHVQPDLVRGRNSPVWSRHYSHVEEEKCECDLLKDVLKRMEGVERIVVGHTVQQPGGISSACEGRVYRVDVGMSQGVADARPEVLEILDDVHVRRIAPDAKLERRVVPDEDTDPNTCRNVI